MDQNDGKRMKNQAFKNTSLEKQSGSIILWIFIFIGLFAFLGFTMTRDMRGSADNLSSYQADLAATEILDYARTIKATIQELKINGCDETQISFDTNALTGYSNSNAPSNNSCHVFHPDGGGLRYQPLSEDYVTNSANIDWIFTGDSRVLSVGSDSNAELLGVIRTLSPAICSAMNDQLSLDPSGNEPFTAGAFTGSYNSTLNDASSIGDTDATLDGVKSACSQDTAGSYFYIVLLER